jgi:hypothetical protein
MKKSKIIALITVSSFFVLILIVILSFLLESRSAMLPAVVRSEKIFVSAEVDGIIREFFVTSMQEVDIGDPIVAIENNKLPFQLTNLKNEKEKYEEWIESARSGDLREMKTSDIETDIEKAKINLANSRMELINVSEKLQVMNKLYPNAKIKFETSADLFDLGFLSNADFAKAANDFWRIHDDYFDLKADSLVAYESVQIYQKLINTLDNQKNIVQKNANILVARYMVDLDKVLTDINDLEEEIKSLFVRSPSKGVVTDLNFQPGESVEDGDVIVEIADLSRVWVIAYGDAHLRHRAKVGQKVRIYTASGKKIWGEVVTVSPVMERVRALTTSFETANTYSKFEIIFEDQDEALQYITPGERLFARIFFH